jgi:ribokinase
VVVTLGNKGALIVSESQESAPAFRVETVDSVGAGDVFNGTLAVARVECGEMTRAVRFACAAAAISVTRRGAQPSIPEREEIDAFLARHA